MQKLVDDKYLVAMATALENDELGAAVRLLSRIVSSEKPITNSRARVISRMSEGRWDESSEAILEHFIVSDEGISHAALEDIKAPRVSQPSRPVHGRTMEMPIVHPTRDMTVPTFTSRETPERVSIKRAAYDIVVQLFQRCDQSANTGRAVLGNLLKNWPAGDVYEAISAADRQDFLADPRSWIIAHLKHNSTPIVSGRQRRETTPPPMRSKSRSIVTPETAGVSQATAEKIRSRNSTLKLNLDLDHGASS